MAADPLEHAARAQRLQRVVVLLQVHTFPPADRALEDLAGHAYVFDKTQLPLLVHDLGVVRLGVPKNEQRVEDVRDGRGHGLREEGEAHRVAVSEDRKDRSASGE